jgi:hypothetical protein
MNGRSRVEECFSMTSFNMYPWFQTKNKYFIGLKFVSEEMMVSGNCEVGARTAEVLQSGLQGYLG